LLQGIEFPPDQEAGEETLGEIARGLVLVSMNPAGRGDWSSDGIERLIDPRAIA
jgi:hypothetical protein